MATSNSSSTLKPIWITIVIFVLLLVFFVIGLGNSKIPLVLAFFMAYLTFPIVIFLEKKGINRTLSLAIIFFIFLLIISGGIALILPRIIEETGDFIKEIPFISQAIFEKIETVGSNLGFTVNLEKKAIINFIKDNIENISFDTLKPAGLAIGQGFSSITGLILTILNFFLFPLFFFYVVHDYENITKKIKELVPPQLLAYLQGTEAKVSQVLSGYIRGQILVAVFLAILYGISLALIKLKFGFLIGIFAGLLNIIPYAGFTIGITTALIVGVTSGGSAFLLIGIVVIFLAVQLLEGFIITPKLVGDKVGLDSFTTVLALIIGGNLLGFIGVLIAIPVAAIIKLITVDLKKIYLSSEFYRNN